MILGFMKTWKTGNNKGNPTFFVDKIHQSIRLDFMPKATSAFFCDAIDSYSECYKRNLLANSDIKFKPKIHTIRSGNRWKAGMDIHFAINNRTKNYFRFAPVIECLSVQKFEIRRNGGSLLYLEIDGQLFAAYDLEGKKVCYPSGNHIEELAINDGFDNVHDFFEYFNDDFEGQIIHWTDKTY